MTADVVSRALASRAVSRINVIGRAKPGQPQIVANRSVVMGHFADVSGASVTLVESRYRFRILTECSHLQFMYTNWKDGGNTGHSDGANDITVRAGLERDASTYAGFSVATSTIPLHFAGQQTRLLNPGATHALTDPTGGNFASGEEAYIRTGVSVAANAAVPIGYAATLGGNSERALQSNQAHQVYTTGDLVQGTGAFIANGYGPSAIIGIPRVPKASVFSIGDSIDWGQGDSSTGDGIGGRGHLTRGLMLAGVAHVNVARSGVTPLLGTWPNAWRNRAAMHYATDVIIGLGINQLGPTPTDRQIAFIRSMWTDAKRAGKRVHHRLISCQTSGTFADAAGQTINAQFAANRATVNAAIIAAANAGEIDGYFDPGSAWEDPNNPGKFLPNATTDGTHPTATFHTAAALITRDYINARILS